MSWHDLLAYYEQALSIEKARMRRVHKVIIMVPRK